MNDSYRADSDFAEILSDSYQADSDFVALYDGASILFRRSEVVAIVKLDASHTSIKMRGGREFIAPCAQSDVLARMGTEMSRFSQYGDAVVRAAAVQAISKDEMGNCLILCAETGWLNTQENLSKQSLEEVLDTVLDIVRA